MSEEPLPVEAYQQRSLGLLELVHHAAAAGEWAALLVVHAHHRDGRWSGGVTREIDHTTLHNTPLPVFYCEADLHAYRDSLDRVAT